MSWLPTLKTWIHALDTWVLEISCCSFGSYQLPCARDPCAQNWHQPLKSSGIPLAMQSCELCSGFGAAASTKRDTCAPALPLLQHQHHLHRLCRVSALPVHRGRCRGSPAPVCTGPGGRGYSRMRVLPCACGTASWRGRGRERVHSILQFLLCCRLVQLPPAGFYVPPQCHAWSLRHRGVSGQPKVPRLASLHPTFLASFFSTCMSVGAHPVPAHPFPCFPGGPSAALEAMAVQGSRTAWPSCFEGL